MAKKSKVDLSAYKKDDTMILSARCAHFLDWCARNQPGLCIAPNIMCKHIMGYKEHTPMLKSKEVVSLRGKYSTIRKILRVKYERALIVETSAGVRASIDSEDILINDAPKKIAKVASAKHALVLMDSLIDIKTVPHTAENAPYRKMYSQQVVPLLDTMMTDEFKAMLELPAVNKIVVP
jgi:hypothetical protein